MAHNATGSSGTGERRHRAGLFDIRTMIGSLLGLYGLVLTLTGLIGTDDSQLAKTDDFNINLWAGIGLIAAGIFFIVWVRVRPIIVPENPEGEDVDRGEGRRGH